MDIDIILIDNIEDNKIKKIKDIDNINDNIIFDEEINKEEIDEKDEEDEELEFDIILENPSDNLNL